MTIDRDRIRQLAIEFTSPNGEVAGRALSELLRLHSSVFDGMCRRFTGGRGQDSDDLYQEFAMKLMARRSRFKPDREWLAWARVVLRNLAFDRAAKQNTLQKHIIPDQDASVRVAADADRTAHHQAAIDAMKAASDACVRKLPDQAREMLLMREIHGMTFQAIAERFQLSGPSRAKSLCDEARSEVRKCMELDGWKAGDLDDK